MIRGGTLVLKKLSGRHHHGVMNSGPIASGLMYYIQSAIPKNSYSVIPIITHRITSGDALPTHAQLELVGFRVHSILQECIVKKQ